MEKDLAVIQHQEAYDVWQTYALGKALPKVVSVSHQGKTSEKIITLERYPIYEHLAFKDEMIVWRYIEENYLNKYSKFMCLRFEWSSLACWEIHFPGSRQLGEDIMPEELNLPQTILDALEVWHRDRDVFSKPWNKDDNFDYVSSDAKGLACALSMRPYISEDVYFEYNLFREIKMVNGVETELPVPSCIFTLSNRRYMKTCFEQGNTKEIHRLVAEGFDLNLVHDGTSILGELIMTGCDFEKVGKNHLKAILSPTRLAMVRLLLSLGADPNIGDTDCNSPLIWDPIIYFDIEMIRLLAEMGADLNWQDEYGVTLFDLAVSDYWYDFFIATDKQYSVRRPTEDEMLNADAELSYLFDVAAQVGAPLPDHLKVLRDLGAKNGRELGT